jgi:regulator of replication initiation timing
VGDTSSKTVATLNTSEKSPTAPTLPSQPPIPSTNPSPSQQAPTEISQSDEPFKRFYSTFESLFSKLSAPLAFAGLPLTPEEPHQPEKAPSKQPTRPTERATAEPDYSRLFSKAALRAVREEPGGNNLGAAESFYVVPTTGGTMPYASILTRNGHIPAFERDGARNSEDLEEFVDARETPGPPSPLMTRGGKRVAGNSKTMEELQLENAKLRDTLDNVTNRLWQFEVGAQTSSAALHQSIRASMAASVVGGPDGGERVESLEEQVRDGKKELERMGRENEKLKGVVGRYRERWEKLKEGARVRREGTGGKKDEL